ncbi:MAG: hypothetical protein QW478_03290, partial [Candidatus Micrarchaeaceae archaeon]
VVHWVVHEPKDRNAFMKIGYGKDLVPDLPIPKLFEYLTTNGYSLYIGNDSGPSHWAVLNGMPTVILHPPQTNPVMLSVPSSHLVMVHPQRTFLDIPPEAILGAVGRLMHQVKAKVKAL